MAIAVVAGCTAPAAALAEGHSAPVASDSLPAVSLPQVSVTAQRADARTPIAFSNITARDIEAVNTGRDVPYLLMMTPSVVTTSDAGAGIGYTSIRIRGTEGSRINVTTNGIPVNDSESSNVYWVNMPDLASSLRDIQVQRGVGTSTNGSGAFGGSINMITEAPSATPFAMFSGTYGMYNTHKETIKVGTGLMGGHWSAEARISNIGTDGYIDRASANLWSYFGQVGYYSGATSVRLLAFGGKERTYMAWDYASKEEMEEYGRRYNPCGKYTDKEGKTAYYPDQFDNYVMHNFQLLFKHRFGARLVLDAALHYTKGDGYYEQYKTKRTLIEYGLDPYTLADGTVVKKSDLVRLKKMDNEFGGFVFNLTYNNGPLNIVGGGAIHGYLGRHFGQVSWVRNYLGDIDPLQEYYRNTSHKLDGNLYIRGHYAITSDLSAYVDLQYRGVRYTIKGTSDTYDYNISGPQQLAIHANYNFFNPKVGLNYTFLDHNRVYASVSVAHKEPVRDNFIDCDPDRRPVPERLTDYELGYNYTSKLFSAGVNMYYMYYKNQLVPTGRLSDTGNAVSENVHSSYRMGIELQASLRPCSWFDWDINATISRNRIKDFVEYIYEDEWTNPIAIDRGDTRIAFSPDFILNNAFNFHVCGFDASLQSHYVSRQYLSNVEEREQSLKGYFITDLAAGYTFKVLGLKSVRLGVQVNNLFSNKYCNNGYAGAGYYLDGDERVIYRYAGFAAQAPINVLGSINVNF